MPTPVMRDGRLVGNPLQGGDLTKLDSEQKHRVLDVLNKAEAGKLMTLDDLNTVMKARKATGASDKRDPMASIRESVRKLQEVMR